MDKHETDKNSERLAVDSVSAGYVSGMMVEITTEGYGACSWGKLLNKIDDSGVWRVFFMDKELDFHESEFRPSAFHRAMNERLLSHNAEVKRGD